MSDMLARYQAAERVLDANVARLVLNETVSPHWVGPGADFWYRRQRPDGAEHVLVDAAGKRRAAFDHERVASVASAALGEDLGPWSLDVLSIEPGVEVLVRAGERRVRCDLAAGKARVEPAATPDPKRLISPDGRRALFARDDDLWLLDLATGTERRLTDDGQDGCSWGQYPDSGLLAVIRRRSGLQFGPYGWSWSPDGRFLVGGRTDERHIEPYPFLESAPQDGGVRPRAWMIRQPLMGEPAAVFEAWVIEADSGRRIQVQLPEDAGKSLDPPEPIAWTDDGERFYTVVHGDGGREARLVEVGAASGKSRLVIAERPEGYVNFNASLYNRPNVRLVRGCREAIWFSERSGFGHLYRYDVESGALLGALTSGDWLVRDIIHVDEARQWLFFTGAGREGGDPYERRVYRVGFDGGDLVLLTPEAGDHALEGPPLAALARLYGVPVAPPMVSPDASVFIDSVSTVQTPAVTRLRSTSGGAVIATLETADASALYSAGWRPPEPFTAKAADGSTDLYGVIWRPSEPGPGPVPLVDSIYGGPQVIVTPHNFAGGRGGLGGHGRSALAALGFAVVSVDGRGTPLRSKAFQNAGYGRFADVALEDHVAVLRQLRERDPSLGGEIGVYGHSFGGYVSARALLRHPDVYKVGVSSAGSHSLHAMYASLESYLGAPDYGGGARLKPRHDSVPENYRALDSSVYAEGLRGKLMLAYGDMDENALPAATLQLIDALIKANRSPDLLYLPNRTHGFASEPYFVRRLWDYFVTHLMQKTPPTDYLIAAPGGAATIG